MSTKTELYNTVLTAAGGEADPLDNTETTLLRKILVAAGGNAEDLPDNLKCTLLCAIADAIGSGGGSGGGADSPDILENLPISLDFSEGDQVVSAPDGMVVKSAIIQKPETLIPDNVADGVNIGGVIGTLATGGSSARIAIGTIAGTSESGVTVEHGLGIVPDIVILSSLTTTSASGNFIKNVVGFSTDFKNKIGYPSPFVQNGCYYKNGTLTAITVNSDITTTDTTKPIHNANAESFQTGYRVFNNTYWVAIGGLT